MKKGNTSFALGKAKLVGGGLLANSCSSLCLLFRFVLVHSGRAALLCYEITEVKILPHQSHPPKLFLYKIKPLRWMQTWKQLVINAPILHLTTTKMSSANVLKHFHKLPGSLPALLSWPLLWAACPYRQQPREGKTILPFSDSLSPWQPSWTNPTENRGPLQYRDFARSQIHSHAREPEVPELLLQNKLQDATNRKYRNSISFTITQQNWQQQSCWVRRTELK